MPCCPGARCLQSTTARLQFAVDKLSDRELRSFGFGEGRTAKEIAGNSTSAQRRFGACDHIKEKMEFTTSVEMIRQAVRWVETQRLDGK
jgi:hypothetical protein